MNEGQSHSINTTAINIIQWQTKIDWQLTHQPHGPNQDISLLHGKTVKIIQLLGFQSLCAVISAAVFCQESKISCSHCHWRWYVCFSPHSGNRMCHNRMRKKPLVPKNKKFKIVMSYDEVIFTMFGEYKYVLFTHIKQKGAPTNTTACGSAIQKWTV